MSLSTNVTDLATRVATEAKSLRTLVNGNAADLSALDTTAKTSLVAAINELVAAVTGASGIDDGTTGTTTSWSSSKTQDEIDAAIAAIVLPVLTDLIDDTTPSSSTVYSSTKTNTAISTAVGAIDLTDLIDDVTPGSATVYSSTKTNTAIAAAVAALVASAPGTLDTLDELAAALGDDAAFATTIATSLGNRVRVDTAAQGLNSTQQGNARTNIAAADAAALSTLTTNVGDTTANFVTTFEAGLT